MLQATLHYTLQCIHTIGYFATLGHFKFSFILAVFLFAFPLSLGPHASELYLIGHLEDPGKAKRGSKNSVIIHLLMH